MGVFLWGFLLEKCTCTFTRGSSLVRAVDISTDTHQVGMLPFLPKLILVRIQDDAGCVLELSGCVSMAFYF